MKGKHYTSFYITEGLRNAVQLIMEETGIEKTEFYTDAFRHFLTGSRDVDSIILVTKRSDPRYIKRDVLDCVHIENEQYEEMGEVAKEKGCAISCIIFQALIDWVGITLFM